ncbi:flagellar biosynthesis regulator FlaF [Mangrovibrevibacter kandeliae]|uniref:flagellar biosynthesis regulator FlaF n=1 Tax=Mangrovibrevibacter kandeliae TaxID=2968473 RepID=UPI0021181F69|nr:MULTISPECIES: flagellar biosynthesis regulator FlaF [unclassified Aurantimonas]MCQ8780935.1 flagellar biosynthesis regulator FlaF [Aurantimonas sp. CSK15Z-1]MCW4113716.1 flagellar biosynthesis regulator FlaF [Aurantimonas sp. MSK8Z-1]
MYQFSYSEVLHDNCLDARERERQALDRCIELMQRAERSGPRSRDTIEAVHLTRQLWTFFIDDLGNTENSLPEKLRADLISIGVWTLKEVEAIRIGKSSNWRAVIDICTAVRDGLN